MSQMNTKATEKEKKKQMQEFRNASASHSLFG